MKNQIYIVAVLAALALSTATRAVDLTDLMNPDDVMLRKPAQKSSAETPKSAEPLKKDETKATAQAEAERRAQEAKAAEEAAARKAAEEAAARKAAEEAAAKAAAEKKAAYLANPDPDERPTDSSKKKLVAEGEQRDVTETVPTIVVEKKAAAEKKSAAKKKGENKSGTRQAVITADRTEADFNEGVILFDQNVSVDDGIYQLHANRAFVFLNGTNDLKRIVALGNVAITNGARTALCAKAVYKRAEQQVVLYGDEKGPAELTDASDAKAGARTVYGARITYWIETGAAAVEKPVLKGAITGGEGGPKSLFPANEKKKKK